MEENGRMQSFPNLSHDTCQDHLETLWKAGYGTTVQLQEDAGQQ